MDCDRIQEWITLATYGELEDETSDKVEKHLIDCHRCQQFQSELADGLGRLATEERESRSFEVEFASGLVKLEDVTRLTDGVVRRSVLRPFLAFAAGLLCMWMLTSFPSSVSRSQPDTALERVAPNPEPRFAEERMPPPATTSGLVAQLALVGRSR
jgi:hypothetical protein